MASFQEDRIWIARKVLQALSGTPNESGPTTGLSMLAVPPTWKSKGQKSVRFRFDEGLGDFVVGKECFRTLGVL